MKTTKLNTTIISVLACICLMCLSEHLDAQRLNGGGNRGGGARQAPRTSNARPSPSQGRTAQARPSQTNSTRGSINGGSAKTVDRSQVKSKAGTTTAGRDKGGNTVNKSDVSNKVQNRSGNETNVGNKTNIGNKVDIDTGDKNVNVNIDNSKDINIDNSRKNYNSNNYVRRSPAPYYRPPYHYGGFSFSCHFGYSYHPYQPYYYGPSWHPWGFFIATLTATAIVVSVNNAKYHYDQGVFYEEQNGGYTAVQAPNGAVVTDIPDNAEQVVIEQNVTNNYYYGGTYYEETDDGYTVVPPTAGSVVTNLPEGAEEVKMGDQTFVKYGDTYYQPIDVEGQDKYEVAQVEDADAEANE